MGRKNNLGYSFLEVILASFLLVISFYAVSQLVQTQTRAFSNQESTSMMYKILQMQLNLLTHSDLGSGTKVGDALIVKYECIPVYYNSNGQVMNSTANSAQTEPCAGPGSTYDSTSGFADAVARFGPDSRYIAIPSFVNFNSAQVTFDPGTSSMVIPTIDNTFKVVYVDVYYRRPHDNSIKKISGSAYFE